MSSSTPAAGEARCVLVTGAAKRLGRRIALDLASAGWNLALHYRHSALEAEQCAADCRSLGVQAATFGADLADEAACRALVPLVLQRFGRLDAVVNNASTFEHDSAVSFSYASLEQHLRSNTAPAVLLAQALHQHLGQRTPAASAAGVVVNLLDQKLWNLNPDFFSYTLSKAALHCATTMLALALAPLVRVVGVAPGLTLTSHLLDEDKFAQLHRQSPLGRSSSPEDVAAAVRFALDNRSVTGSTLLVDGGQHLQRFERDFSLM
jgi:NAD(P)-dependent dehydrogenase (short-subunit alcohol dehydrogenase family)